MDETRKEFENQIYNEDATKDRPLTDALIEIAWQLKRLADKYTGKEIDPYAMEGTAGKNRHGLEDTRMIFCSRNEDGDEAWKLVLSGEKTVTRRPRPLVVGKDYAVCPGRGKKAVCRIRVLSCVDEVLWFRIEFEKVRDD